LGQQIHAATRQLSEGNTTKAAQQMNRYVRYNAVCVKMMRVNALLEARQYFLFICLMRDSFEEKKKPRR
jgi:uncharacterized membrane protein YadS